MLYSVNYSTSKNSLLLPHLPPTYTHSHTRTYSSAKAFSCQRSIQKDSFKLCAGGHNSLAEEGNQLGMSQSFNLLWRLYKYDRYVIDIIRHKLPLYSGKVAPEAYVQCCG